MTAATLRSLLRGSSLSPILKEEEQNTKTCIQKRSHPLPSVLWGPICWHYSFFDSTSIRLIPIVHLWKYLKRGTSCRLEPHSLIKEAVTSTLKLVIRTVIKILRQKQQGGPKASLRGSAQASKQLPCGRWQRKSVLEAGLESEQCLSHQLAVQPRIVT